MSASVYGKNRYWWAVLYPENMLPDWMDRVEELLQLPFAYCIHDRGLQLEDDSEERKVHVHLILAWSSPTTHKHALEVFSQLAATGKRCFAAVMPVYNIKRAYDYLIHDTDDARKKGKYEFAPSDRVTGNCFDIGAYVQVSQEEKDAAFDNLTALILSMRIENFADFVSIALEEFDAERDLYRDVIRGHNGFFDRLTRGIYLRSEAERKAKEKNAEINREIHKGNN